MVEHRINITIIQGIDNTRPLTVVIKQKLDQCTKKGDAPKFGHNLNHGSVVAYLYAYIIFFMLKICQSYQASGITCFAIMSMKTIQTHN